MSPWGLRSPAWGCFSISATRSETHLGSRLPGLQEASLARPCRGVGWRWQGAGGKACPDHCFGVLTRAKEAFPASPSRTRFCVLLTLQLTDLRNHFHDVFWAQQPQSSYKNTFFFAGGGADNQSAFLMLEGEIPTHRTLWGAGWGSSLTDAASPGRRDRRVSSWSGACARPLWAGWGL